MVLLLTTAFISVKSQPPMDMELVRIHFMRHLNTFRMDSVIYPLQTNRMLQPYALRHAQWLAAHPGKLWYSNNPVVSGVREQNFMQTIWSAFGDNDFYAEDIGAVPVFDAGEGSPGSEPFPEVSETYKQMRLSGYTEEMLAEIAFMYWKRDIPENGILNSKNIRTCFFTGVIDKGIFYFVFSALGNPWTYEEQPINEY